MPTPPRYRYEFKTGNDTEWYYVSNGQVLLSSSPKYFFDESGNNAVSPVEWKEGMVGYARNEKYHGLFRKFSVPLSFTFEAMQILEYVYARDGYEGTVLFVMSIRNDIDWLYSETFKGEFDFSMVDRYKSNEENYFRTNVLERGLGELLKSKEDVPFELTFDGNAFTMYHEGIDLRIKYEWVTGALPAVTTEGSSQSYVIPLSIIVSEGDEFVNRLNVFQSAALDIWDVLSTPNDDAKFLYAGEDINNVNYRFKALISVSTTSVLPQQLRVDIIRKDFVADTQTAVENLALETFTNNGTFSIDKSDTISFNGDRYNYFISIIVGSVDPAEITVHDATFNLEFDYRLQPTEIKAYRYLDFLKKLFKSALGSGVNVLSQYLANDQDYQLNYDNNPKWTSVTSGSAVRRLETPKIKTTIADAFQDMRRWGLGLAVEGNDIRIERFPYFYQRDRRIFTLNSIASFRMYTALDQIGNQIRAGYNNQTNNNLNALQDFHTTLTWNFPSRRTKNTLNWVSPYQASIYPIEYARLLGNERVDTTDSQYDEQVYLIEVDGNPATYNAGRPILYKPAGYRGGVINADSVYNVGLTPARTLFFNREYLSAMAYGVAAQGILNYQATDKNPLFESQLNSIPIDEDASRQMVVFTQNADGSPVIPLFLPVMFEVEAVVPDNLFQIMNSNYENRYGVIRFPYKGHVFEMFINDIGLNPETKDLYTIRGLSSPLNDLTKL